MKLAIKFILWFVAIGLLVLMLDHFQVINFSNKAVEYANGFVSKKLTGAQYPFAVFSLLLISSVLELLLLFGLNYKWVATLKQKALGRLVSLAGALLGGLTSLTGITFLKGNLGEAEMGLGVLFMILMYVAAPLFIVSVLHMLRAPDSDPARMKLIKCVAASTYVLIALISIYGMWRHVFP